MAVQRAQAAPRGSRCPAVLNRDSLRNRGPYFRGRAVPCWGTGSPQWGKGASKGGSLSVLLNVPEGRASPDPDHDLSPHPAALADALDRGDAPERQRLTDPR